MLAGVSGRDGNHAVWHVEGATGHVLAHVLIHRQTGKERIALALIPTLRAAIGTSVKVDVLFLKFSFLKWFMLLYLSCFTFQSSISFFTLGYFLLYRYGHDNVFSLARLPERWENGRRPRAKRAIFNAASIVITGEWLWNSTKFFVACFCSLFWP